MSSLPPFPVPAAEANATLAAILRVRLPDLSWSKVRALVESRRVKVRDEVCLDPARRVKEGDCIELLPRPAPRLREVGSVVIRHLDTHVVVVEKPARTCTVRHPTEREWSDQRKALAPTLEELVPAVIAQREGKRGRQPRLRIVQRLDKETSGLVVFARTLDAERGLGRQFRFHTVIRRYLAVVAGDVKAQCVRTFLVRDRGDGRRGSTHVTGLGKEAITHVEVVERLGSYTLVGCRLETGKTHQIRIHLSELGHPVCGDRVYIHKADGSVFNDRSGAPRLALHATELGFDHPVTGEALRWEMPPPPDLAAFLEQLRQQRRGGG